jgi:hypothetical protein
MTKAEVEVITSVRADTGRERRRNGLLPRPWSRVRFLPKSPGQLGSSQSFRWRQQLCDRTQAPAVFSPVTVAPEGLGTN